MVVLVFSLSRKQFDFYSLLGSYVLRLLLDSKPSTTLVAALDGTMYLVETGSMKVIWSFPTGSPIYDSYQAPLKKDSVKENVCGLANEFLECGDDWALYFHNRHGAKMVY